MDAAKGAATAGTAIRQAVKTATLADNGLRMAISFKAAHGCTAGFICNYDRLNSLI
ncbi:MAG: hypothetical protein WDN48_00580 [Pseudolabrys sp.]